MLPNRQHSKPKILGMERRRIIFMLEFNLRKAAELSLVLEYCLLKGVEILKPSKQTKMLLTKSSNENKMIADGLKDSFKT